MARFKVAAGLALLSFLSAISPAQAADQAAADKALLEHGKQVYEKRCMACHEGAVMKAPHRTMLELMQPSSIVQALTSGVMKLQAKGLALADRKAVAAFVTGITTEAPLPKAQMCKVNPNWFDRTALPDGKGWGIDGGNNRHLSKDITGLEARDMGRLRLKWAFAYPGAERARSQPMTAGGALFVGSQDGTVYALDQKTGCARWTYRASTEVRTSFAIRPWIGMRGQKQDGMLFFGDLAGSVYAVNIETGKLIWRLKPSAHPNATITATPALFEDRLYIAVSSLEVSSAANPAYECCKFRGSLASYDALTGKKRWVSETIREPLVQTGLNSKGTPTFGPSGAPIWGTPVVDEKRRRIYVGTGENYSSPATRTSDAVLAYHADTGRMLWSYQETVGDAWNMGCEVEDKANCPKENGPDFDFGAATLLAKTSDGRDIVLAGQKSGALFALDPDQDGKLLWTYRVGRGGIQGGIHFGMAVDGDTLYVPISDFDDGHKRDLPARPGMHAFDIRTGKPLWSTLAENTCGTRKFCGPGISAAVTAIPGGVVGGAMDGILRAYDARTGAVLWSFDSARKFPALGGQTAHGGSFGGASGPMFKNGMMFVNSGYGIYYHMPGNALLAFELEPAAVPSKK